MTVKPNDQGVEVYGVVRMSDAHIKLKTLGWRRHANKKCWYKNAVFITCDDITYLQSLDNTQMGEESSIDYVDFVIPHDIYLERDAYDIVHVDLQKEIKEKQHALTSYSSYKNKGTKTKSPKKKKSKKIKRLKFTKKMQSSNNIVNNWRVKDGWAVLSNMEHTYYERVDLDDGMYASIDPVVSIGSKHVELYDSIVLDERIDHGIRKPFEHFLPKDISSEKSFSPQFRGVCLKGTKLFMTNGRANIAYLYDSKVYDEERDGYEGFIIPTYMYKFCEGYDHYALSTCGKYLILKSENNYLYIKITIRHDIGVDIATPFNLDDGEELGELHIKEEYKVAKGRGEKYTTVYNRWDIHTDNVKHMDDKAFIYDNTNRTLHHQGDGYKMVVKPQNI